VGLAPDGAEAWRAELPGLGGITAALAWSPDGTLLVAGSHRPDGSTYESYLARIAY